MGERIIPSKFNVHENYTRVNIVNPYRFGSSPPPSGGVDPDLQAKINFAYDNAILVPSQTELDRLNQRVINYKATGGWDKDDAVFDFTGEGNMFINFRLIDIKRRVKADAFGGLTWASTGVKGDGSTGYINPHFNPTFHGVNYTLNNAGYLWKNETSSAVNIFGMYSGATSDYILVDGNKYRGIHAVKQVSSARYVDRIGVIAISRTNASTVIAQGALEFTESSASGTFPNNEIYILARNRVDLASTDLHSLSEVSFVTFGASKVGEFSAIQTVL